MDKREKWIDYIKGLAIYLVVLGHSIQYLYYMNSDFSSNIIFSIIYSFHMALFNIISGYLFYNFTERYSLIFGLIRKTYAIFIPCISWGFINYIVSVFVEHDRLGFKTMCWFLIYHNWFLWAVFYCSVVTIICLTMDKSLWKSSLAIIVVMFMIPDYLNSIDFKMMFPFFIVGYFLKKKNIISGFVALKKKNKIILKICWGGVYIILMLFCVSADDIMALEVFCIGDFVTFMRVCKRWLINLVGSFMILFTIGTFNLNFITKKIFSALGKNTLGIYMVQTFFFAYGIDFLCVGNSWSVPLKILYILVMSIIITYISYCMVNIIKKSSLFSAVLLGRL